MLLDNRMLPVSAVESLFDLDTTAFFLSSRDGLLAKSALMQKSHQYQSKEKCVSLSLHRRACVKHRTKFTLKQLDK